MINKVRVIIRIIPKNRYWSNVNVIARLVYYDVTVQDVSHIPHSHPTPTVSF